MTTLTRMSPATQQNEALLRHSNPLHCHPISSAFRPFGRLSLLALVTLAAVVCSLLIPAYGRADAGRSLPQPGDDPMDIVLYEISRQAVGVMPNDKIYPNLTMGTIEGDDGRLDSSLRTAVSAVTDYRFLEMDELNTMIGPEARAAGGPPELTAAPRAASEDVVMPAPLSSGLTAPLAATLADRPGWLLSGRFVDRVENPLFCFAEVFLEMKNLMTGEVAFARSFSASYIPAMTKYLAALILLLLVVLVLALLRRRFSGRRLQREHQEEGRALLMMADELRKSRDNLQRARQALVSVDMDAAVQLRELQNEAVELIQTVETLPGRHPLEPNRTALSEQARHNRFMLGLLRNLSAETEKLLNHAGRVANGDMAAGPSLAQALQDVGQELKNCSNKMYDNRSGRA